jgi:carbonic anhydrase/acetyltransferase-like protein (isoleucine patch superfamily)
MLRSLAGSHPDIAESAFVSEMSYIVGDVRIESRASIWPFVCLRGDFEPISVGSETNVQDFTMLHGADLGARVSVGHNAVIDQAHVGDETLIGMSSTVLENAVVGSECIVAAGAVVREGQEIPDRHLAYGVPAETRPLTDEHVERIAWICDEYLEMMSHYRADGDLAAIRSESSYSTPVNGGDANGD